MTHYVDKQNFADNDDALIRTAPSPTVVVEQDVFVAVRSSVSSNKNKVAES